MCGGRGKKLELIQDSDCSILVFNQEFEFITGKANMIFRTNFNRPLLPTMQTNHMLLNYMLMSRDMFISPKDLPITYKMNGQKLIAELFQPQRIDRPSMVDVRNIVVIKM